MLDCGLEWEREYRRERDREITMWEEKREGEEEALSILILVF
jgi:hypothetical protein